ncbi:MAG: hypothetical protein OES32_05400 [Acidobacteriota bacterium]|nr:hypothetical protein [Acidobacteriota bacterium]MDH3523005.1 hypothetical protein [Acidobacteriota bacterium]
MRLLAYLWAAPSTLLGLVLGALCRLGGGALRLTGGVVEVEGRWLAWLLERAPVPPAGVEALTLGHVVLGRSPGCLERCRAHERIHVRQYERWGPLFLPAYAASSLWQWLRGRDPYRDNRFEREAYAAAPPDGGATARS